MSKFKMTLKLTGLEIEIEGSREDVPLMTRNIAAQLGNIITPAANIAHGSSPALTRDSIDVTPASTVAARGAKRGARRPAASDASKSPKTIDWTHDVQQWGGPVQGWNPTQKSIWLLYVADAQGAAKEMTISQIASTFNKHFRQAGLIQASNVSRDLGKAKTQPPIKVGEDSTKDPATWFLTDEGKKMAQALVLEGRGIKAEQG